MIIRIIIIIIELAHISSSSLKGISELLLDFLKQQGAFGNILQSERNKSTSQRECETAPTTTTYNISSDSGTAAEAEDLTNIHM